MAQHDRVPHSAGEVDGLRAVPAERALEQPHPGQLLRQQGLSAGRRGQLRAARGQQLFHGGRHEPLPIHQEGHGDGRHRKPVQPRLLPAVQPAAAQQHQYQPPASGRYRADIDVSAPLVSLTGGARHNGKTEDAGIKNGF
ncbi:hypothetical protein G6F22_019260 [Rhizopus arrhizus]|nr:hypothetical protein G6F22_019260 [Rhizopus arrhizus]